jgi:DNA-binding MarR family transcriptional regulator
MPKAHTVSLPAPTPTKLDQILAAARSRHGTSIAELTESTGWQPHTIRAALSRLRQRGHHFERSRNPAGETRYRLRKAG